jgi:hypothetical protein
VDLAAADVPRIVEGVVGILLVLVALVILGVQLARRQAARRRHDKADPGVPALARFVDTTLSDPTTFGGGADAARVRRRRDTVTYGYLAVVEEYGAVDGSAVWCTLTVMLPGRVPFLVADNRAAWGRPNVPMDSPYVAEIDDAAFDSTYAVGAAEPWLIARVMSAEACQALVDSPVQRLMLHESSVVLRTFDGVELDDDLTVRLSGVAERFLASTPSFLTSTRAAAGSPTPREHPDDPLPPGFYGPDRP